jgi:hypothetical protein
MGLAVHAPPLSYPPLIRDAAGSAAAPMLASAAAGDGTGEAGMRNAGRFALALIPAAALAGCGQPYTLADGAFDRETYRRHMDVLCRTGLAANPDARTIDPDRLCRCAVDRLERGVPDETLHARIRASDRTEQELAAVRACWTEQTRAPVIDTRSGRITRPAGPPPELEEEQPPPDGLDVPPPPGPSQPVPPGPPPPIVAPPPTPAPR